MTRMCVGVVPRRIPNAPKPLSSLLAITINATRESGSGYFPDHLINGAKIYRLVFQEFGGSVATARSSAGWRRADSAVSLLTSHFLTPWKGYTG
jgi:hypothetical protein